VPHRLAVDPVDRCPPRDRWASSQSRGDCRLERARSLAREGKPTDDVEAAECQLATFFTEVEFVAADVAGRFMSTMSPDDYEVRQFLTMQMMDESRHLEVFRKRALANGGGLMRRVDSISGIVGGTREHQAAGRVLAARAARAPPRSGT